MIPQGVQVFVALDPVSYTHLDVYKRQLQCSRGRRVRARGEASTSMPSSRASSVASSTSTCLSLIHI